MKKFGKRPNRGIEYVNEDDVAKALLNKKTEMALYKDLEPVKEEPKPMTRTEYKQAEESMSTALDMLRKERGQKTIEQEEIEYDFNKKMEEFESIDRLDSLKTFDRYDLLDDVTTQSITDQMNIALVKQALIKEDVEDTDKQEDKIQLSKPSFLKRKSNKKKSTSNTQKIKVSDTSKQKKLGKTSKTKIQETGKIKTGNTSKIKVENTSKLKKQQEKPKKEKKPISPIVKIVAALVALSLVLMGGYAYKLYVYDPQNVVSEEQQEAYDRLIAYADEYDMMSESEKLELLDMESDYECLLNKQKSMINDYFKDANHVGKTYTALVKELRNLKNSLEDESGEGYQSLKEFLEGWANYDDYTRRTIINYKSNYDSLNSNLQKKIDDIARTNCKKSFLTLYNEYHEVIKSENNAQISANNDRIIELESQLSTEQATLDDYKQYSESLDRDLQSAKENNLDTAPIQEQIDTNNQMILQSQQTVDALQAEIDQLKAENEQLANV